MKRLEKLKLARQHARIWQQPPVDTATQQVVRDMCKKGHEAALIDAFHTPIRFGTGGLRAVMGIGASYMNEYTVALITHGLAKELTRNYQPPISVVISYDSRLRSEEFAKIAAQVFSSHHISVHLFAALRPTPLLSYTLRSLGAQCGVMITASHNPKEYNGYKVYNAQGAQLTAPMDEAVMCTISRIKGLVSPHPSKEAAIRLIDESMDHKYISEMRHLLEKYGLIHSHAPTLQLVYSSIHGTGITLVPQLLQALGYGPKHVSIVQAQATPNGTFPTVHVPNPETPEALNLSIQQAQHLHAPLVMATDPDADRLGVAVQSSSKAFVPLTGHQIGVLILDFLLKRIEEQSYVASAPFFVVKTIVTTELFKDLATSQHILCYDTLTGFKYIAALIHEKEPQETFLCGVEESYGYLIGNQVRDKDGVLSAAVITLLTEYWLRQGKSLLDRLNELYMKYGYYEDALFSLEKKGATGAQEIQTLMEQLRTSPPTHIGQSQVIAYKDYKTQQHTDLRDQSTHTLSLPSSNVLQFFTEDGTKVSIRPSGTEPKVKMYLNFRTPLEKIEDLGSIQATLYQKKTNILQELHFS